MLLLNEQEGKQGECKKQAVKRNNKATRNGRKARAQEHKKAFKHRTTMHTNKKMRYHASKLKDCLRIRKQESKQASKQQEST